ncbi:hypothetical protein LTR35_004434 [Friedmanniomyces endolithicus]|nr:hypothetical protein LTR35_004434 [Friedmanniomyces endolithicus]
MSGTEATVATRLIHACIGTTKVIIKTACAVQDAQGLPLELRELCEQPGVIQALLESAQERFAEGQVTEDVSKSTEPLLKQLKQALGELLDIFRAAFPQDGDNRSKRVWKGARGVVFGRDSPLHKLLGTMQDILQLLEQKEMYVIGDKLDALQHLTAALAQDESGKNVHSGTGTLFSNESGTQTNHLQSGENNRQINNPAVYHEGPARRPETPRIASSNVPFRREPDYINRKKLDDQITATLLGPGARAALVGLGGVGKSQIAIEYCYRIREQSRDIWVLWIHASNAARFEQSVRDVADLVKIDGRKNAKADIYALIRGWLRDERNGRWTVVLDNADDASFLVEGASRTGFTLFGCLPPVEHGTVLVTTRSETAALRLVDRGEIISVHPTEDHALALLEKKLGQHACREDLAKLARELEYMPLALAQASAYIQNSTPRCNVPQYLEMLGRSKKSKTNILSVHMEGLRRDHGASNAIMLTWQISFEQIHHLLSLISFFQHKEIPAILLRTIDVARPASTASPLGNTKASESKARTARAEHGASKASSNVSADLVFEQDITTLRQYHFISVAPGDAMFEMHRLDQLAAQLWLMKSVRYQAWADRSIRHLDAALPNGEFENWQECRILHPHANTALDLRLHGRDACLSLASVLHKAAWFMKEQGQHTVAEAMTRRVLETNERMLGETNPSTLTSANNLVSVLLDQGKHETAGAMSRWALRASEKVLGREHPHKLASANNLASVLHEQGKHGSAEAIIHRALKTMEEVLGGEHHDTLLSVNNLAGMLRSQGKYEFAEVMIRRALEAREKVLRRDHPHTLASVNDLASVLYEQGRQKTAEAMFGQVLEAREKVLGNEHPDTLWTVWSLASLHRARHQYEAATKLYERAHWGLVKAVGPFHRWTVECFRQSTKAAEEARAAEETRATTLA